MIVLLLVLLVVGLINRDRLTPNSSVSEGIIGTYTKTDLPLVVTTLLSRGLVKLDTANIPQPDLAESWSANKDLNEYTFKLRSGLVWSDGTPIKAGEMNVSVPDSTITTPDDQTIVIKLKDSFSPLPSLLNKPVFKKGTLVGVGPYRVSRVDIQPHSIFVSRVDLKPTSDQFPNLTVKFYQTEEELKKALSLGSVQSIIGVNDPTELTKQPPFALYSKPSQSRIVTIFYNTEDPILSDENFRLALSYGAPSIAGEEEAVTPLAKNSWAFNGEVKNYLDNQQMAKSALAKVKNGKDSTITLTVTESLKGVGERIVEEWNKQGVKAVTRVESGLPQNFQALLITQKIPSDPDQYQFWHSTQTQTNISKISLPRLDKDLEDGRKIADLDQRKALYKDFQKVLLDHAPATFLYFPKNNVVYVKKVEGDLKKVLDLQLSNL